VALSKLELVPEPSQPQDEVHLTCFDGAQTFFVSISRTDLDDYARQRGWGPLAPSDQYRLVKSELDDLLPLVEGRHARGDVGEYVNRPTGGGTPLIKLTPKDLEQAFRRVENLPPRAEDAGTGLDQGHLDGPPENPVSPVAAAENASGFGGSFGQPFGDAAIDRATGSSPDPLALDKIGTPPFALDTEGQGFDQGAWSEPAAAPDPEPGDQPTEGVTFGPTSTAPSSEPGVSTVQPGPLEPPTASAHGGDPPIRVQSYLVVTPLEHRRIEWNR
jgi:hypothetical protein